MRLDEHGILEFSYEDVPWDSDRVVDNRLEVFEGKWLAVSSQYFGRPMVYWNWLNFKFRYKYYAKKTTFSN